MSVRSSAESADRLNHLAAALAHEFAAPIGLLDPVDGVWRMRMGTRSDRFPNVKDVLAAAHWAEGDGDGQAVVWQPTETPDTVWLVLRVPLTEAETVVAAIGFASTHESAIDGEWGSPCPAPALRAWGESAVSRLNPIGRTTQALLRGGEAAWPALLDHLASRLRVSDPPERFQKFAALKLRAAIQVETIVWVPQKAHDPPVAVGARGFALRVDELREWVEGSRVLVQFDRLPHGWARAGVRHAVAVAAVDTHAPAGWLVAINPRHDGPFSESQVKLIRSVASLVIAHLTNARLYRELSDMLYGVIHALTAAIDAKDPYTSGHSERVARIAVQLGAALGLSTSQRGDLYLMGLLHDVGKIGIEDDVLKKRGPLSVEEYLQVQSHVRIGVHILSDLTKLRHILPGVRHHHERLDGSGYPAGLAGDAIPLEARILAVADAFDAMSSSRPYRARLAPRDIDETLRKGCGGQWDPRVVRALFTCRREVEQIHQKGLGESLNRAVDGTLRRPI